MLNAPLCADDGSHGSRFLLFTLNRLLRCNDAPRGRRHTRTPLSVMTLSRCDGCSSAMTFWIPTAGNFLQGFRATRTEKRARSTQVPIYRLSDIETRISRAIRSHGLCEAGWAKEEALEAAADAWKVARGRSGSSGHGPYERSASTAHHAGIAERGGIDLGGEGGKGL